MSKGITLIYYHILNVGPVAHSVCRLTTDWTVRDQIPVRTTFSARPDRSWGPPSLLYNGYRVFLGGKLRPGRAADHSPPSSTEGSRKEYSYTCTHSLGHTGPVTGSLYFTFYHILNPLKSFLLLTHFWLIYVYRKISFT